MDVSPSTLALPGCGGRIGDALEAFRVDEVPLYAAEGDGPHRYVRLQKCGWTTDAAVRAVAKAAGVPARDIGTAGLKDRAAVTTQWISVPDSSPEPDTWDLPDGLAILEATRHRNKLRTGHLLGNRFTLTVVDVDDPSHAEAIADVLRTTGTLNVFGAQRFGHGGRNLAKAIRFLDNGGRATGKRARFERKMWPSVVQSECFNRYAVARAAAGFERLFAGETVRLAGAGRHFRVEDADAELPRLHAGDIVLTGRLPGGKVPAFSDDAGQLEAVALHDAGLTSDRLGVLERLAPGARRDLVLVPEDLTVETGPDALVLSFALPAGAYATRVLREFTRQPFGEPIRGPAPEDA
jgi:tRNA pseudouridine13 synthase